ncbi:two-component system sensor histidine kinase NtrB [Salidesulfovibrio onnuriiensis]|uniref:two-component system sensor histidine kinase NtrB n=1 Tax=Salidesulfovibrio onnuriiensis TaxID=2583823 RepID=UPI0011C84F55|nr:ATP-binding protein [Salidesulfovibrio onnuriiensis]
MSTGLNDLIGIEHSKLGYFQELQRKIEELHAANIESEENRREIAAILDGITDVMMVLSADLRIISVNRVFTELFEGVSPEGRFCYELFRNQDTPCPECPAFKSLETGEVSRENAFFRIRGRKLQFEMVASPLSSPNQAEPLVLIFKRDVTKEREYQAKYYQAEKMATIGRLATGVAHELNNPLMAISGYAEGLRRRLDAFEATMASETAEDFREYIRTILDECNRCRDIVRSLLNFGHPSSAVFTPVNLNNVVSESLQLLHYHLKKHPPLRVEELLDASLPDINAEAPQIKQVLLNLLTNATDAIGEEPGVITVRTFRDEDGYICLQVQDTGCGIPEKHLGKLFDPFFTTKGVGSGIGIGLSTCYSIVSEHKGHITVASRPERGSTFTVRLPSIQEPNHA